MRFSFLGIKGWYMKLITHVHVAHTSRKYGSTPPPYPSSDVVLYKAQRYLQVSARQLSWHMNSLYEAILTEVYITRSLRLVSRSNKCYFYPSEARRHLNNVYNPVRNSRVTRISPTQYSHRPSFYGPYRKRNLGSRRERWRHRIIQPRNGS